MRVEMEKALRSETERELRNYRRNGSLLRAWDAGRDELRTLRREEIERLNAREVVRMRRWRRVIDRVLAEARAHDPVMYRFMRAYFALVNPRNARLSATQRNLAIMDELSLSMTMLYNLRRRAVSNVLLAAVEAGLLRPYGLRERAERS